MGRRLIKRPLGHTRMAKPQTSIHSNAWSQDLRYLFYIINKSLPCVVEQRRSWPDCAHAQAGLDLCCSHMLNVPFLNILMHMLMQSKDFSAYAPIWRIYVVNLGSLVRTTWVIGPRWKCYFQSLVWSITLLMVLIILTAMCDLRFV